MVGLDWKALNKIIENLPKTEAAKRYQDAPPTLDDVRAGFAKVTHASCGRVRIKWIPLRKLKKSLRRLLLARAMIAPISRRLNYSEIARQIFVIEPLPPGALPAYLP